MKIVDGFILKNIADTNVVVPSGSNTVSFRSIISLNESGAFLWGLLQEDTTRESLIESMLKEYDVDRETVEKDVDQFLNNMKEAGLLE